MIQELKKCTGICGVEKTLDCFSFRSDTNKYNSKCKECVKQIRNIYIVNNKEKIKLRLKSYYKNNKGKISNINKQYRIEHQEEIKIKRKDYYLQNKKKME